MMKLIYVSFILLSIFLLSFAENNKSEKREFLFFNTAELNKIKSRLQNPSEEMADIKKQILKGADYFSNRGPWSVTFTKSPAVSGDPHDFFSEGPYWWPDPDDPDGPYIRRDGERNPDRFMAHKEDLIQLYQAVSVLSLAGYLFDDRTYSEQAAEFLHVWFLDPKTRMNPHLNYAQAIRNKSSGRGVGIIDSRRFSKLIELIYLLEYSGHVDEDLFFGLRNWFDDYLVWMMTSENGLDEKYRTNNHGSWWCTQVAAYARFAGHRNIQKTVFNYARDSIIAVQFETDGRQPHELERTRSFQYSIFNLDALALLSRMAKKENIDLWRTDSGKGTMEQGVRWIYRYILNPDEWPYPQIGNAQTVQPMFLFFAGQDLDNIQWLQTYKKRIRFGEIPKEIRHFDPFIMLLNLYALALY